MGASSITNTVTLSFDTDPSWGDLYWLVDQAKKAGITPGQPLDFEWDQSDMSKSGIQLTTIPPDED